jgi:hypothetical protein
LLLENIHFFLSAALSEFHNSKQIAISHKLNLGLSALPAQEKLLSSSRWRKEAQQQQQQLPFSGGTTIPFTLHIHKRTTAKYLHRNYTYAPRAVS